MKKTLKYFSLLLMVMVLLTGCGDPKEKLEKGLEKIDKADSISFKADIDMTITEDGSSMSVGVDMAGEYSDKTKASHMTVKTSAFGMSEEEEMYTVEKDGYEYSYSNYDDEWTYTKSEVAKETEEDTFVGLLDEAKSIKKVKTDKKGYERIAVTVSKEKLNDLLENNSDIIFGYTIEKDVVIDVYLKGEEVKIVKIDLSEALIEEDAEEGSSLKTVITLEIKDLNKSNDLKVPEEVTKNAKEEVEIEFDEEETDLDF